MNDDGQRPMAIGHMSDTGDLIKIFIIENVNRLMPIFFSGSLHRTHKAIKMTDQKTPARKRKKNSQTLIL